MANRVIGRPFPKGTSGNPLGRPKSDVQITELARAYTSEAIEALVAALQQPRERVAAACALLDRGWGKPRQEIDASLRNVVGGIDVPPLPESIEEWLERRRRELAAIGTASSTTH